MKSRSVALAGLAYLLAATPHGTLNAVDPALAAAMSRVDGEANNIGAGIQAVSDRIDRLSTQLTGSMTPAEQQAAATQLAADSDALDAAAQALIALGADPTNPVPNPTKKPS